MFKEDTTKYKDCRSHRFIGSKQLNKELQKRLNARLNDYERRKKAKMELDK